MNYIPQILALPNHIDIFGLKITFYAICIIIGMFSAYYYGLRIAKKIGINEDDLFWGFIIGVVVGVLGARIYYVIFSWADYKDNIIKVLAINEGGLAIHGALIAAGIFAVIYARIKKLDLLKIIEVLAPGFLIGQTAGRWGNFFNQEANGGEVTRGFLEKIHIPEFIINNMYFRDKVTGIVGYFHPTFFYEFLWNMLGLLAIILIRKLWKKYWMGDAGIFYLIWYGIGRFFIEGLRTDPLPVNIFGLELLQAQVISVIMVFVGIALLVLRRIFKYKPISFMEIIEENKVEVTLKE